MAKFLGKEPISKLLLKQSYPAFIGLFVIALYNLVDTIFIGQSVGALGIAGLTLALPIQMFTFAFALIIGIGSASYISRKLGEKKKELAERALGHSIFIAFVSGLILTVLTRLFSTKLISALGASQSILPYSLDYINYIIYGFVFSMVAVTLNNIARAEGRAKVAMLGMIIGAISNIILDAIFIFGFGWGIKGAAFATACANFISFVFLFSFFLTKKSTVHFKWKYVRFNWKINYEIVSVGMSAFFRQISFVIMTIFLNFLLVKYGGDSSLAAIGMCQRLLMFVFMPAFGVIQGLTPIVGYNYGAKLYGRVRETIKLSNISITIIMTSAFLILMFLPEILFKMFISEPELLTLSANYLRIMIIGIPFVGIILVASGVYQALGKAKAAMFFSLLRQVILQIPLLLILPQFWGIFGILLSFPISDMIASLITYFITKRSKIYNV